VGDSLMPSDPLAGTDPVEKLLQGERLMRRPLEHSDPQFMRQFRRQLPRFARGQPLAKGF
jgi:hypothetical protein